MNRPHVHVRARALKSTGNEVSADALTSLESVEVDGVEWPVKKVSADFGAGDATEVTLTFYGKFTSEVTA